MERRRALALLASCVVPAARADAVEKGRRLKPWEPVDPAFNGCSEGFCGTRGRNSRAIVQPGAKPGDYVYCPVSGAVFQVQESSRRADLAGQTLYVCCEACARYFAQNRERVMELRGMAPRKPNGARSG
jgi:YHS domain-containing protein